VDCDVDPNEPSMPGKVSYDQAKAFTSAFLRGQPHKASTLAAIGRDKTEQLAGRFSGGNGGGG
jgi:pyruvate dehydrogenase (quinone)